ncbi:MAG: CoA transferase [Alphaproteobacteria bacterium]|nr:CoA transferase [Alphaproteobacteria bacterium]
MSKPLSHIRVLDLTRILAGPWATQLLADLGAEVIKIERPGEGDDTRLWGPPFIENADGSDGDAAYFLSANRGKKSVAIDIAKPEGQNLVRQLALKSDVFIENFKLGGLAKYGLDYASLSAANPRLVYCSITGFGQDGPYAKRAGYDFMIQGMSGLMSITGEADGMPLKVGVAVSDLFTGLYACNGIQAALIERERSGEGTHIDMSLLDSQIAALANQNTNYLVSGNAPGRMGNAHPNIVPYQGFETADGHIILAIGNNRQFGKFCEIAGLDGVPGDPRYADNRQRVAHRAELVAIVAEAMKQRTTAGWIEVLEAASVPCGPINGIDDVFADPHVMHRNLKVSASREDGTQTPTVANPIRFSGEQLVSDNPVPALGSDTDAVLKDVLALSDEALETLRDGTTIG